MKRSALGVALALPVLAGLLLAVFAQSSPAGGASVESNGPEGRRALRLLFEACGFRTQAWHHRPGDLPTGAHVLWLAQLPGPLEDAPDREAPAGAKVPDGARHRELGPLAGSRASPLQYRRFVEQGGTLVLRGDPQSLERLREEFGFEELDGLISSELVAPARPPGEGAPILRGVAGGAARASVPAPGEQLDFAWPSGRAFDASGLALEWSPLLQSGGDVLALAATFGRGRLALLADDAFLANGELGGREHAVLAVRLGEQCGLRSAALASDAMDPAAPRLLFDEYALGRWQPETLLDLALASGPRPFTLHLLALALLVVWRMSWAREFPRDPPPLESFAPLSRARAQASLYSRARRFDLLAAMSRRGTLHRLAERAQGLASGAGARDADEFLLRATLARAPDAATAERWKRALADEPIRTAEELERLDGELARTEREVLGTWTRAGGPSRSEFPGRTVAPGRTSGQAPQALSSRPPSPSSPGGPTEGETGP
jgi:hypothetical protein